MGCEPGRNTEVPVVSAINVSKEFRTSSVATRAVSGVTLEIGVGEYVVLAGPSGCGKSTLLSLLGALEDPSEGTICIGKDDLGALSEVEKAKIRGLKFGFVFQAFHLIPYLTVLDNIRYPLQFHRNLPPARQREMAAQMTVRLGLEHRMCHFPDQLSGGQQQRVAIGRALVGSPQLLLADEPTGNLDSESGDLVMELLRQANSAGTAICLVTHDSRFMRQGDRTLLMRDGMIVDEATR